MMIRRMLSDIATELCDLDFILQLPLKACKEYLPLSGLKSIHNTWDTPCIISNGEMYQLLMYEVIVAQLLYIVIHKCVHVIVRQPFLSLICQRFHES